LSRHVTRQPPLMGAAQLRQGDGCKAENRDRIAGDGADPARRDARRPGGLDDGFDLRRDAGHDVAGLVLGEELRVTEGARQVDPAAEPGGERHLAQTGDEPAIGDVMHRAQAAKRDLAAHKVAMALLQDEIDRRWWSLFAAMNLAQIEGLAEMLAMPTDLQDGIAFLLEGERRHARQILDQADTADG